MELKVGSWYRTRDGKRAVKIVNAVVQNDKIIQATGRYTTESDDPVTSTWNADGSFSDVQPCPYDLTEEIDAKMLV